MDTANIRVCLPLHFPAGQSFIPPSPKLNPNTPLRQLRVGHQNLDKINALMDLNVDRGDSGREPRQRNHSCDGWIRPGSKSGVRLLWPPALRVAIFCELIGHFPKKRPAQRHCQISNGAPLSLVRASIIDSRDQVGPAKRSACLLTIPVLHTQTVDSVPCGEI